MKKRFVYLVLLIVAFLLVGCSSRDEEVSENFGFILRYGYQAKNILNTFENQFTKDMVPDPPITVNLRLSEEQLDLIYKKMWEINFFDYPEEYAPSTNSYITPFSTYEFEVKAGAILKKVRWEDKHLSETPEAEKMRELIELIRKMIEGSPEYKELPRPRGGYD